MGLGIQLNPDPRQGEFTYDHWINTHPLNYLVRWAFSPFCRAGNGDYGGKSDSPKVTPGTAEPGGLLSMGSPESDTTEAT